MGGNHMGKIFAATWQKVVSWLSVLGSAHIVDDGSEKKQEQPKKPQPPKLHLVSRHN